MIRYCLVEGDKSSAGGEVLEGIADCIIMGKRMTFLGAKVFCPACKTTGEIVGIGPRHPNDWMGKGEALDGDLCICKCKPAPVMLASTRHSSHIFTNSELAAMGFDAFGRPLARVTARAADKAVAVTPTEATPADELTVQFDEQVQLRAIAAPSLAGMRYAIRMPDGTVQRGEIPADGTLPRIPSHGEGSYSISWGDAAAGEDA